MPRRTITILLLLTLAFVGGCQTSGGSAEHAPGDAAAVTRDHGYALLYSTIGEECDVDKVLIIKRPAAPVADLIKAIGQFSRDTKNSLDLLAKETPAIDLKNQGLPEIESRTRDAISSTTSKQIIFHGGKEFEFRILLTQHEALNYITHLVRTLADQEPRENRRRFLEQVAKQSDGLHEQVLEKMKAPYVGPAK